MSGLLDFALGFGQGAAGAVVQDRQMALQEQRQANLERLRAQFAREQQTAEIDEAQSLITSARGGDEAAQNRLRAMGKDWRDAPGPTHRGNVQNFVDSEGNTIALDMSNPAHLERIERQGLRRQANAPATGEGARSTIGQMIEDADRFDAQGRAEEAELLRANARRLAGESQETGRGPLVTFTFPDGRDAVTLPADDPQAQELLRNQAQTGVVVTPATVQNFTYGGNQYVNMGGKTFAVDPSSRGGLRPLTQSEYNEFNIVQELPWWQSEDGIVIPAGDYLGLATGPINRIIQAGFGLPIIGDFIESLDGDAGEAQTRAAASFRFFERATIRAYRLNAGRTTNLDATDAKKLVPRTGFFARDGQARAQMVELRSELERDIGRNMRIVSSYHSSNARFRPTQEEYSAARSFLQDMQGLLEVADGMIFANDVQSIRLGGRPLSRWSIQDFDNMTEQQWRSLSSEQQEIANTWNLYLRRNM